MIRLRSFQQADLERLYRIDQVCFPPGIAYSKAELRYFIQHPRSFAIVAEDGPGRIAGFCVAQESMLEGTRLGHIITIDVLPEARKQGTGRALMEAVETRFRVLDIERVRLEVAVDNLEAQAFYQKMGFEAAGRIRGYYLGRLDALVMEKEFSENQSRNSQ